MLDKYFPLYIFVFFSSLLFTAFLEILLIPTLSSKAKQPIYAEGPDWHLKKQGTPTMGGLGFLAATSLALLAAFFFLIYARKIEVALSLITILLFAVSNALVGIIDDLTKLKNKQNQGLTSYQKLGLQFIFAFIFLYLRAELLKASTEIYFSFGNIDLGIFYYPLGILTILGTVNCANLTDGIDGLASGVAFAIGTVLFYMSAALFSDVAIISSAIIGAAVGFLIFNIHPAKIFMGDTGSLFLGALIVGCVFAIGNPLLIIPIGGVYVLEGVSVILQVLSYKLTGKRIFKMAPFHHHLEKCKMSETKICMIAIIATFLLSIPAFIFFLP